MSTHVNIKPRVSAYKVKNNSNHNSSNKNNDNWNDASPPLQDDHDNNYDDDVDNDKGSKIQRTSRQFLWKSIVGLVLFFIVAIWMQSYLEQQQTTAGKTLTRRRQQQQQQQQQQLDSPTTSKMSFQEQDNQLAQLVQTLDQQVRARKAIKGVIMETDDIGLPLTQKLQQATLQLLQHRYGSAGPFRVRIDVEYPPSIMITQSINTNHDEEDDHPTTKRQDYLLVEMAPTSLLPCSVFYFLELARTYQSGSFHRNADHVLQAKASSKATAHSRSMPFQEYSPQFPHAQYTVGYAGRPSGPEWYVSILDNTYNHGPGSQQKQNPHEADSLFGKLVNDDDQVEEEEEEEENENDLDAEEDEEEDEETDGDDENHNNNNNNNDQSSSLSHHHDFIKVINTIHSVPQKEWLDAPNHIAITKMTILHQQQEQLNDDHNVRRWVPVTFPTDDDLLLVMQH
jgi:hypothetical protein